MEHKTVTLAEAKAHLSELTEQASRGEEIVITKHGRAVGRLGPPEMPREAVDVAALRRLTGAASSQEELAGDFLRRVRDESRY